MIKLLAALALLVALAAPALAAPEDVANEISSDTTSPFCPGVTLHDCPSGEAEKLRAEIIAMAEDGKSERYIRTWLADQYGITRMSPEPEGEGWLAWILPGLALLVGLLAAGALARHWVHLRDADRAKVRGVPVSDEERRRLEEELEAFRSRA
jgi:cytochrome c-type biogenesis protein CcmH/NrfF